MFWYSNKWLKQIQEILLQQFQLDSVFINDITNDRAVNKSCIPMVKIPPNNYL